VLWIWFGPVSPAKAASEEPPLPVVAVIEAFMAKQFPDAFHRFWIVEVSSETTEEELVLDLHAFVADGSGRDYSERRFLLLLVQGRLLGVQGLSLDAEATCVPDAEPKSKEL
jgi:hypothetical protein